MLLTYYYLEMIWRSKVMVSRSLKNKAFFQKSIVEIKFSNDLEVDANDLHAISRSYQVKSILFYGYDERLLSPAATRSGDIEMPGVRPSVTCLVNTLTATILDSFS